ncbi:DUF1343 domain-containing protein [bacterium]|nr:DUF1343 domain-containing protein [bacterium]
MRRTFLQRKRNPKPFLILASMSFLCLLLQGNFSLSQNRVILGNERFVNEFPDSLKKARLGLVVNHTSSLPQGPSLLQALLEKDLPVAAVFSPEHGFRGLQEAGERIKNSRIQEIPVYSLYGETKKPTPQQMETVDALVYDIQDVGTRFYTYITTLKYTLEAAAEAQKPVYVLDRPNPAGGTLVEGPLLHPEYRSFIGACPIPIRYGLTCGELAQMMKGEGWVPESLALHVIPMENWKREYFWEDTGLPWIPTSPNIPTPDTALIYPGTGLLGGLTLNQGLGTSHPFLQFGAPWLNPNKVMEKLDGGKKYGIQLTPLNYTPRSLPGKTLHPPYENRTCRGIRVHIREKEKFRSLHFTLHLIKTLKENHPQKIRLHEKNLNLLFGSNRLSEYIKGTITFNKFLKEIKKEEKEFQNLRQKYFLYE